MLCGEELDSGDLVDFDVEAASSNDTSTLIVEGIDGPLASCSRAFRFNYQRLLDSFVEEQVPEEDQADIWKTELVRHIEVAMDKNVSLVRSALFGSIPSMNELGLRYVSISIMTIIVVVVIIVVTILSAAPMLSVGIFVDKRRLLLIGLITETLHNRSCRRA